MKYLVNSGVNINESVFQNSGDVRLQVTALDAIGLIDPEPESKCELEILNILKDYLVEHGCLTGEQKSKLNNNEKK